MSKNQYRAFLYIVGFFLPPLIVGVLVSMGAISQTLIQNEPKPLVEKKEGVVPQIDEVQIPEKRGNLLHPDKLTALILVSNVGTEITDLLAPYEILSSSGAFNVVTVAPKRKLSSTTGSLAIIPDYAFGEEPDADLLVIPALLDYDNPIYIEWLEKKIEDASLVLTLCEGTRLVAQTSHAKGKKMTSHMIALADLKSKHKETTFLDNERFILDGKIITSAGITASLDASLFAIQTLRGKALARKTANQMQYIWEEKSTGKKLHLGFRDFARLFMNAGYDWNKRGIGVLVYPGVSEIGLAAFLDTFPRILSARVVPISEKRKPILTRNGLVIIPALSAIDSPLIHMLVVPSEGYANSSVDEDRLDRISPLKTPEISRLIREGKIPVRSYQNQPSGLSFDQALSLLGKTEGFENAKYTSKVIQYDRSPYLLEPSPLKGESKSPSIFLYLRPLLLGFLGLFIAWRLDKRIENRL